MYSLERTRKLKRILIVLGMVLATVSIFTFIRATEGVSSDTEAQIIKFVMLGAGFLSMLLFLLALVLHVLEKDIRDEFRYLSSKESTKN